ncbi:MAG TPA: nucleoid-associated protein [Bacteroidia bacterium]|nr:nucleoid-associated protein [Bacteroidia bacterium]
MIDIINAQLSSAIVHHCGNQTNQEDLILSKSLLEIQDEKVCELLIKFFLNSFQNVEFNRFTFSNGDHQMNIIYQYASKIFELQSNLLVQSVNMAKLLYDVSTHPQIKAGDFFVAYFTGLQLDGTILDAIGIFKSENRQEFLKVNKKGSHFEVQYIDGININKLDKGCLILNCEKDLGYKVCVVDNTNRAIEAHYWRNDFLMVKPSNDSYHATKDYLDLCKNFVTKQMPNDFEVSKTDQIDLLNRSIQYFKEQDEFNVDEFSRTVIQDPQVIESFKGYKKQYENEHELELNENFDISEAAVKKQNRVFKSVLKLDKNFHIYIHGKRELIEKGVDPDGRKFYKIYFTEET